MKLGSPELNVLIIDDHSATIAGIESAVESAQLGTTVCSNDIESATDIMARGGIQIVISEVLLRGTDILAGLSKLKAENPMVPIVVFSGHDNPTYLARALALGATDYLLKTDPVAELQKVLSEHFAGGTPSPSKRLDAMKRITRLRTNETLPSEFPLTDREAQVLRHLALGLSNKEIAASLGISVETVKEHVQNTLRKLAATDRTDAAVRAVRAGLLDEEETTDQ